MVSRLFSGRAKPSISALFMTFCGVESLTARPLSIVLYNPAVRWTDFPWRTLVEAPRNIAVCIVTVALVGPAGASAKAD